MSAQRCITDLRGNGKWTDADVAREAAIYVIGAYASAETLAKRIRAAHPTAKILAYVNPAVGMLDWGVSDEPGSVNREIAALCPQLSWCAPLWTSDDKRQILLPVDITQAGTRDNQDPVSTRLAKIMLRLLSWADGLNICYYTSLGWAYPNIAAAFWDRWDAALATWVNQMRKSRPEWIILGQQFQMTPAPCTALNGEYWEQSPYFMNYSLEAHDNEVANFKALLKLERDPRPVLFVSEVRWPKGLWNGTNWENLQIVDAWAERNGYYVSYGRDDTAGIVPAGALA